VHEACERARRGEGPTLIEAKMMRMKGHAIHDAAEYVPKPLFEYWRKRDPIARLENFLLQKKWLTAKQNEELCAGVDRELEADREFAVNSPMPEPEKTPQNVYCEGCHEVKPKYGVPKVRAGKGKATPKQSEATMHLR
jgi:TPP-dependent pyruvate/acetoin dehydrogenase alpha subunit